MSISKNTSANVGFSLSNKKGSYCAFFNQQASKYHGLFFFDPSLMTMYRFVENIELEEGNEVGCLRNFLYYAERDKKSYTESFFMPSGYNSLMYELDSAGRINVTLDCRDIYDNREWGRNYTIFREKNCVVVEFTKKTDKREDATNGKEEFTLYLAIRSDYDHYELLDKWVEKFYPLDSDRKMNPSKRFAYLALAMHGKRFVFAMSKDMKEAMDECNTVFNKFEQLKKDEESYLSRILHESGAIHIFDKKISDEIKIAYLNAINSLNSLIVHDEFRPGILAGFPWFFQYWSRDSLVSLKAVYKVNNVIAGKILYDYLNSINHEGRLSNLVGKDVSNALSTSDAHGWLYVRCHDLYHEINRNKTLVHTINNLSRSIKNAKEEIDDHIQKHVDDAQIFATKKYEYWHRIIFEIESSLEKSLTRLHRLRTTDQLEYNGPKETWMDTSVNSDDRSGFRIEIQALRLNMYKLMFELTRNQTYSALESMIKSKINKTFWNGSHIADGMNDFTQRPNIFIAAYTCHDAFSNEEWEIGFENNISKTWLDWGGFSTIDKSHHLFVDHDEGEDIKAYHRGDSWFWINNLSAIVFSRLNKEKFKNRIEKILGASTEEILWNGCVGCHSEISDARQLTSRGCFNQAWSNAMFIEMVDEMFKLS